MALAAATHGLAGGARMMVIDRALVREGTAANIGCGPWHLVVEMGRRAPGVRITGIDLSDKTLVQAAISVRRAGLADQHRFDQGDASRLPFEDESLDRLLSTMSLHHWSQPEVVLDEVSRMLRPGGADLVFELRRDIAAASNTLLWFATRLVVPGPLKRIGEPLASCHAANT